MCVSVRVCVCASPIIMIVWEGCFGMLVVVSAYECSHLISRAWIITTACKGNLRGTEFISVASVQ